MQIFKEKTMLGHLIITVSNVERSVKFYEEALKPLRITNYVDFNEVGDHPTLRGFGNGSQAFFWLKEGIPGPSSTHFAFVAKNRAEVDAFYKAAITAGGVDNDSPRARLEYDPEYYAALAGSTLSSSSGETLC